MTATASELARAMRLIRATYGIGLRDAIAMWRGMGEDARRTWVAPA